MKRSENTAQLDLIGPVVKVLNASSSTPCVLATNVKSEKRRRWTVYEDQYYVRNYKYVLVHYYVLYTCQHTKRENVFKGRGGCGSHTVAGSIQDTETS